MTINPVTPTASSAARGLPPRATSAPIDPQREKAEQVRDLFQSFIGQTFFGQLIKAMRTSLDKPAYFHGGQAEEIFQSQLDQTLAEHMSDASASQIAEPMFKMQFPRLADILQEDNENEFDETKPGLADLARLGRR